MKKIILLFLCCVLCILNLSNSDDALSAIRVMLLDGQQARSHPWEPTSPVIEKFLEETGLFDVDQVTSPAMGEDFSNFKPDFSQYQVIVMNYDTNDDQWPEELKTSFEEYVSNGGGLVVFHGADNSFPGWEAYNLMIGVGGWRNRNENAGPYWYYKDGELVTVYSVRISKYIRPSTAKGLGMIGQPAPQYYFDRPISGLLAPCFQAGMVLDGLEEPVFTEPVETSRCLSWGRYREIPPVLVARLRLL